MIKTTLFMENFYILDDERVRQFLITGEDKALLIDTGFEDSHVYEAVRQITDLPVEVIMTHGDMDHTGGLSDFGACRLHRADWHLVKDKTIRLEPLSEGDVFQCGGYCLRTIEIPGHTLGSTAFFDEEKGLLLSGDSVQKPGPIYMFGDWRSLALKDRIKTILPCHHEYPIGPEYIGYNLKDAEALKNGELTGERHPYLPCSSFRGQWTEFYYDKSNALPGSRKE